MSFLIELSLFHLRFLKLFFHLIFLGHIFHIDFKETYYADNYLPNYLCSLAGREQICTTETCGSDCTQHHKSYSKTRQILNQYYRPSTNPREFSIAITATGLCYDFGSEGHQAAGGLAEMEGQYAVIPKPVVWDDFGSIRRHQHEVSHLFGADDGGEPCTPGQRCIMSGGFDNISYENLGNIWCDACKSKIKSVIENYWR